LRQSSILDQCRHSVRSARLATIVTMTDPITAITQEAADAEACLRAAVHAAPGAPVLRAALGWYLTWTGRQLKGALTSMRLKPLERASPAGIATRSTSSPPLSNGQPRVQLG
jgi:hypothetical protein